MVWFVLFDCRTSTSPQREPPGPLLQYNAASHHVAPTAFEGRLAITSGGSQSGGNASNALTFSKDYAEEGASDRMNQRRREQYRQVRAHVQKEDGRLHAYGWSLPGTKTNTTGTPRTDRKMPKVPVPVYCRPLAEASPHMKVFCAAGVNLNGGYTKDGGCIVSICSQLFNGPHNSQSHSLLFRLIYRLVRVYFIQRTTQNPLKSRRSQHQLAKMLNLIR